MCLHTALGLYTWATSEQLGGFFVALNSPCSCSSAGAALSCCWSCAELSREKTEFFGLVLVFPLLQRKLILELYKPPLSFR